MAWPTSPKRKRDYLVVIGVLAAVVGLVLYRLVFVYETSAHASLTAAIFDLYNKSFPEQKIKEDFKPFLIEGSVREDDDTRWLNHFYDPIKNRGLVWQGRSHEKAKDWAQADAKQLALARANGWALAAGKDPLVFTWQEAIRLYNNGEQQKAFTALGHVLHLLEDTGVPEHTRNDPHPLASPYEIFTRKLLPNVDNQTAPLVLAGLNDYFDALANYSNKNFYSADTINPSDYKNPQPDYFKKEGEYNYGFKIDEFGNDYHLMLLAQSKNYVWVSTETELKTLNDKQNKVLTDYWNRLSHKTVQYGAGLLKTFFAEAAQEREKNKNQAVKEKQNRSLTAELLNAFDDLLAGGQQQELVNNTSIDLTANAQGSASPPTPLNASFAVEKVSSASVAAPASSANSLPPSLPSPPLPPPKECVWDNTQFPSRKNLIINEVNWGGSADKATDEWLELKNIMPAPLEVGNWQLLSQSGNIKLRIKQGAQLAANGFLVAYRSKDYSGALRNANDGLRLFDQDCNLVDEVLAAPNWPAGNNTAKKSAERKPDFSWCNGNPNSPGRENNCEPQLVFYGGGGSGPSASSGQAPAGGSGGGSSAPPPASPPTPSPPPSAPGALSQIVISEVFFDAEGSDDGKEFIELYNPTSETVSFNGAAVQHTSGSGSVSKKNFENSMSIAPKSFFLVWLGSEARADMQWLSGSFNNTEATIALIEASTTIDSLHYSSSSSAMPVAGQSLERKALQGGSCLSAQDSGEFLGNGCDTANDQNDWQLRGTPNPQNSGNLAEPRAAPVVSAFQAAFVSSSMQLALQWDGSSSTPSSTFSLTGDFSVSSTMATTTSFAISEVGRNYSFTIQQFDRDGLGSATTTVISQPKIINNLFFSADNRAVPSDRYLMDFTFSGYPILPGNRWHALIFYLNADPTGESPFPSSALPSSANVFGVRYNLCSAPASLKNRNGLVLADQASFCSNTSGSYTISLEMSKIEDNHIMVLSRTATTTLPLASSDYLTVAYYTSNDFGDFYNLTAVDKTHYQFLTTPPSHQAPAFSASSSIALSFNSSTNQLTASWPLAADTDTIDADLAYEIKYHDADSYQSLGVVLTAATSTSAGDSLSVSVRAVDDFGLVSAPLTATWSYPGP